MTALKRFAAALLPGLLLLAAVGCEEDSTSNAPSDTEPPVVVGVSPANGATGVARTATITAEFSEELDPESVAKIAWSIGGPSGAVAVGVTVDNEFLIMDPVNSLAYGGTYTVVLGTDLTDMAGNPLAEEFSFSFTTEEQPSAAVVSTSPGASATKVRLDSGISVTFDKTLDAPTVTSTTFRVTKADGSGEVGGDYAVSGTTATLTPWSSLTAEETYRVTITSGLKATDGTSLSSDYVFEFDTVGFMTVVSFSPATGAENVPIDTPVVVTFSKNVDPSTVTGFSFAVEPVGWIDSNYYQNNALAGSMVVSGNRITWTPDRGRLGEYEVRYYIDVSSGIQSVDGEPLESTPRSQFNTVMFDDNYWYALYNEGNGRSRVMSIDNSTSEAFMSTTLNEDSRWHMIAHGENGDGHPRYLMANQRHGDSRILEGWTDTAPAYLADNNQVFSGRQIYFDNEGGRPSTKEDNESGLIYYMKNEWQDDRVCLKAEFSDGSYQVIMRAPQRNIYQLWFFKNVGAR